MKVLMVCLGNICRSPLAQGILEKKVKSHGLGWQIDSAGTNGHCNEGSPPHHMAQQVAEMHNINISSQKARQLKPEDIEIFDKIWVMDISNLADAKNIFKNALSEEKLALILDMLPDKKGQNVPDPYRYGIDAFEHVYELLDKACEAIVQTYKK